MQITIRERATALLSRFYGYRSFRPGQLEVIEAVASGRDAIVLMPTGGGKSVCYQLPALLAEGFAAYSSYAGSDSGISSQRYSCGGSSFESR